MTTQINKGIEIVYNGRTVVGIHPDNLEALKNGTMWIDWDAIIKNYS